MMRPVKRACQGLVSRRGPRSRRTEGHTFARRMRAELRSRDATRWVRHQSERASPCTPTRRTQELAGRTQMTPHLGPLTRRTPDLLIRPLVHRQTHLHQPLRPMPAAAIARRERVRSIRTTPRLVPDDRQHAGSIGRAERGDDLAVDPRRTHTARKRIGLRSDPLERPTYILRILDERRVLPSLREDTRADVRERDTRHEQFGLGTRQGPTIWPARRISGNRNRLAARSHEHE